MRRLCFVWCVCVCPVRSGIDVCCKPRVSCLCVVVEDVFDFCNVFGSDILLGFHIFL